MNTPNTETLCAEAYASMEKFHAAIKDEVEKPLLERIREQDSLIELYADQAAGFLGKATPPTADGKTPGQVAFETWGNAPEDWRMSLTSNWEAAASAVLAAFGGHGSHADSIHKSLEAIIGTKCLPSQMPRFVAERLAAFGQASLEAGIKRMEAVEHHELFRLFEFTDTFKEAIEAIRARLIAAAREGQVPSNQPAEIPWIEWNGGECPLKDEDVLEWECSWPDGERTKYGCKPSDTTGWDHITRYRVTKWREGQPATVDLTEALAIANKSADEQMRFKREAEARAEKAEARIKDLEEKNKRQADELKDISHRLGVYDNNTTTTKRAATEKCNEIHRLNAVLQKTEAELAGLTLDYVNLDAELVAAKALPQLRQLSQAGPVPEGCVRVTGYLSDTGKWAVASFVSSKDTHSADIRLPATAVKVDPYFALKAAHAAGKVIEVAEKRFGGWNPVKENHNWTFPVEEYRIKPESTFEAHGQTWTKHTPGDPMPCDGEALVFITSDSPDVLRCASLACDWHWGTKTKAKITGWRYADKPKAPVPVPQCDWKEDSDGNWDTSCKQCMCFEHAPPYEQGYKFCHHCGLSINFITFTEEETEP